MYLKMVFFSTSKATFAHQDFFRVEFLLPFPSSDRTMKPGIEQLIQRLSTMWDLPSFFAR